MATSDDEEKVYTKPGAIRRGGNSNTAVGFFSRGVQPTDVQTSDDYSPPTEEPVVEPIGGSNDGGDGGDTNSGLGGDEASGSIDNPRFIDVNPTVKTLARVASLAVPGPVGFAAGAANAGINLNNLDWANAQRERLGLEKLGGWETVKAAAGFSDYTDGKVGTVDVAGKQREVTRGGGLVGDGPDVEKRTAMTPAEALARQAANESYSPAGGGDGGGDNGASFGATTPGGSGTGPSRSDRSLAGGSRSGGGDGGGSSSASFGAETSGGAGSGPARGDSSLSGGSRDGGGNSGGGGSSRVICTELYRQGKISRADWLRDLKYTSEHLSPQHVRGYHAWAIPTVRKMRASRCWTSVWCLIGQARANQIAYLMGDRNKPDCFGAVAKILLEGFCWGVGFFVGDRDAAAELKDDKELN